MKARVRLGNRDIEVDLSRPIDIALELNFDANQPRHFGAPAASTEPFSVPGFSGAVATGARQIGGGRLNETTLRPSILVDPPRNAKVSTLEAFGPLTCVYPYTDIDVAIAAANSLPVSFQSSIFTQDISVALDAAERLDASAVMINDHTAFRTDWMPFAGRRESGYGVGGIPFTVREMTAEKMIVFKH